MSKVNGLQMDATDDVHEKYLCGLITHAEGVKALVGMGFEPDYAEQSLDMAQMENDRKDK